MRDVELLRPDQVRRARRALAQAGAIGGLVGSVVVFVASTGFPLSDTFLAAEAGGLVVIGPIFGALLGASILRMGRVFTAIASLAFCFAAPVGVALVTYALLLLLVSHEQHQVWFAARMGTVILWPVLTALGFVVAAALRWRRARILALLERERTFDPEAFA